MRFLIVAPSWVGDMVMAQSLFIALKQRHPGCQIDIIAPPGTLALADYMPEVSSAFEMPVSRGKLGLMARIQLGRDLRQHHYDQAILLPNTWKSALTPFFANIPLRTGYVGECRWGLLNDARGLDKSKLTQTVQRFVALADGPDAHSPEDIPKPLLRVSPARQKQTMEKYGLHDSGRILALCPGAEYGEAKRWSVTHFAEVARDQVERGWQVWLLGSAKDRPVANQINRLSRDACLNLAGETSLGEVVDLLSSVDRVVSNDSGLMHVASALNKPLIAIYGSSDPSFTPPLSDKAKILYAGLPCSPCFKRECPLGHMDCLNGISASSVILALNALAPD